MIPDILCLIRSPLALDKYYGERDLICPAHLHIHSLRSVFITLTVFDAMFPATILAFASFFHCMDDAHEISLEKNLNIYKRQMQAPIAGLTVVERAYAVHCVHVTIQIL